MDGGLILYLHGFCSSPASWKARLLGEAMAAIGQSHRFACPLLSPVPDAAIAQAEGLLAQTPGPHLLVGSSLGGHYATVLAERHHLPAILINPAVIGALHPERFVGQHQNYHSGAVFDFTPAHAAQLCVQDVQHPTPAHYWLLLETGDETLDYRQAMCRYRGCRQDIYAGGNHSFSRFPECIPDILEAAGYLSGKALS